MRGIDISHWQKGLDLTRLKDCGYDFVILKAGGHEGNVFYHDECFKDFVTQALRTGLHVGAYFYSTACSIKEAKEEADYFNSILKDYYQCFDMPLFMDFEDKEALSQSNCLEIVETFCHTLAEHGYFAGVYASLYVFNHQLKNLQNIAKWTACWTSGVFNYEGIHQYTNKELVLGYYVDGDNCNVDYPRIILESGRNGFPLKNDLNGDGVVNSKDIVNLVKAISTNNVEIKHDVNGDNRVNSKDVVNLMKEVSE